MGKEKGLMKDPDKFSRAHQEISDWFSRKQNQYDFLRHMMHFMPKEWNTELEIPIKTETGFLIGFADAIMFLRDYGGSEYKLLLEFKSTIRDKSATLRQLKSYSTYSTNISQLIIIHNDDNAEENTVFEWAEFFKSQNIFLFSLSNCENSWPYFDYELSQLSDYELSSNPNIPQGEWTAKLNGYTDFFDTSGNKIGIILGFDIAYFDMKYQIHIINREVVGLSFNQINRLEEESGIPIETWVEKNLSFQAEVGIQPTGEACATSLITSIKLGSLIIPTTNN